MSKTRCLVKRLMNNSEKFFLVLLSHSRPPLLSSRASEFSIPSIQLRDIMKWSHQTVWHREEREGKGASDELRGWGTALSLESSMRIFGFEFRKRTFGACSNSLFCSLQAEVHCLSSSFPPTWVLCGLFLLDTEQKRDERACTRYRIDEERAHSFSRESERKTALGRSWRKDNIKMDRRGKGVD